jgi:hypothetical protein
VTLDYMYCANDECRQLVIRAHESFHLPLSAFKNPEDQKRTWLARPQGSTRSIDPLVPEPFRTDYLEAARLLPISPRMSAVMSRRVLADLLEKYDGQTQFNLSDRVEKFANNPAHPSGLRGNLDHFREVANFGAHTQTDDQAEIIDVDQGEAEWMLDLLDRLFDYFIVTPEKDRGMRASMDEKIQRAGRKPISPQEGASE